MKPQKGAEWLNLRDRCSAYESRISRPGDLESESWSPFLVHRRKCQEYPIRFMITTQLIQKIFYKKCLAIREDSHFNPSRPLHFRKFY